MSGFQDQQSDTNRLRQRADESERRATAAAQEDVVIEYPRRLCIRSANGTFWQVSVTDAGVMSTTNVGTSL